jgi:hypothetical protein
MSYSLNINWTAASPVPANGYRVKYWPTSNPASITTVTPNVSGTSHTISGLAGTSYSGTVEASCGGGNFSTAQNFSATFTPTYYYYALNEYACSNCTLGSTAKVGRSTSVLSTSSGTHYKVGSFSYVVTNQITPAPLSFDVDLDTATQTGANCSIACGGSTPFSAGFTITNQTSNSVSFSNFLPTWFTINSPGSITPLTAGNSAQGTHGGFTGDWSIFIDSGVTPGCLVLQKNQGTVIGSIAVSAGGTYTFTGLSILNTDEVVLSYNNTCQ